MPISRVSPSDFPGQDNEANSAAAVLDRVGHPYHWLTLQFLERDTEVFYRDYLEGSSWSFSLLYDFVWFLVLSATALTCFIADVWVVAEEDWPLAAVVPAMVWASSNMLLLIVCVLIERDLLPSTALWPTSSAVCAAIILSPPMGTALLCVSDCNQQYLEQHAARHAMAAQVVLFCAALLPSVVFSTPIRVSAPATMLSGVAYIAVLAARPQSLPPREV